MKTLQITNEIIQNWIDAEKQMVNFDGDDHPAFIVHNEVGKAIFGDNIKKARNYISDKSNEDLTVKDLEQFINLT